jgi:hypothetical protein
MVYLADRDDHIEHIKDICYIGIRDRKQDIHKFLDPILVRRRST